MSAMKWSLATGLAALAIYFLWDMNSSRAQPGTGSGKDNPGPTKLYFGVKACVQCHTTLTDKDVVLCRCNEVQIWEKEDKHRNANKVLKGQRAQQMASVL